MEMLCTLGLMYKTFNSRYKPSFIFTFSFRIQTEYESKYSNFFQFDEKSATNKDTNAKSP